MSEDEPAEGGGCAGATVLGAATLGLLFAIFTISREAFILLIVVGGWGAILWAAKRVPRTPDPAPPPVPERGSGEEPQVNVVRDTGHPNRWLITRPSEWLDWTDTEDRDVS